MYNRSSWPNWDRNKNNNNKKDEEYFFNSSCRNFLLWSLPNLYHYQLVFYVNNTNVHLHSLVPVNVIANIILMWILNKKWPSAKITIHSEIHFEKVVVHHQCTIWSIFKKLVNWNTIKNKKMYPPLKLLKTNDPSSQKPRGSSLEF
jgi:hypothetical protein